MRKHTFVLLTLVAALLLFAGCGSETELPTEPTVANGTIVPVADTFVQTLNGGSTTSQYYYVYLPPGYDANRSTPYPVVYLLHGFGGNENYFVAIFNATEVADKLIADGDIDPMVLVMPSAYSPLGGSFYTNSASPFVGTSMDHIINIRTEVEANYNVGTTRGKRAIGGHSMGGFGAVRIAESVGGFGSVSSLAGPLSFSAFASPTFIGTLNAIAGYDPTTNDEAAYKAAYLSALQASVADRPETAVIKMVFAMSAAFSPTANPAAPRSNSFALNASPLVMVDFPITPAGAMDIVGDGTGAFERFMMNDAHANLAAWADIANVELFIENGADDPLVPADVANLFVYGTQAAPGVPQGYIEVAGTAPAHFTVFDGTATSPADHSTWTYEVLKRMLKFHGDNFY